MTKSSASTPFTGRFPEWWSSAASTLKNTVRFRWNRSRAETGLVVFVHNQKGYWKQRGEILRLNLHLDLGLQTVGIFRVGSSRKRVRQV